MTPALAEVEKEVATRAAAKPKRAALLPSVDFSSFEFKDCALIIGSFSLPPKDDGATQGTEDAFELSSTPPAPEMA